MVVGSKSLSAVEAIDDQVNRSRLVWHTHSRFRRYRALVEPVAAAIRVALKQDSIRLLQALNPVF